MSYSYSLILTTTLSTDEVLHLLNHLPGFATSEVRNAIGPGIVASVRPADAEDKEITLEYEGFEPDLSVYMTQKRDNEDDLLEVDNVVRVTMLLLHHCTGNAVLRAEEALWLRLHNNALLINSNGGLVRYYQDLLPLITLPYEAVPLPDD